MAKKENKVENKVMNNEVMENEVMENACVLPLTATSSFGFSLDMIPSLSTEHEVVEGIGESDVFKFTYMAGKNETTVTIRDKASVVALTNIEKLALVMNGGANAIVREMRKVSRETIKKSGLSPLQFFKKAFDKVLAENTIERYYRISLLFVNPETFEYRTGIDRTTAVSNLDVALPLFKFKERKIDINELSEEEIEEEYKKFYAEYILKDLLHLYLSQTKLKEEVSKLKKGVIDSTATDKGEVNNDENGKKEDENGKNEDNGKVEGNSDNNKTSEGATDNREGVTNTDNFAEVAKSIAIISKLLADEEIKAKFAEVVDYIQNIMK